MGAEHLTRAGRDFHRRRVRCSAAESAPGSETSAAAREDLKQRIPRADSAGVFWLSILHDGGLGD
eukprot:1861180-Rhodomonas_salina.1